MKNSNLYETWLHFIRNGLFLLIFSTLLTACGGGGSGGNANSGDNNESGDITIALTDAEGDFETYTVDVVSLKLTRQDGAVIETLPLTTRVDFSRYVEVTEFLTVATIPSGVYTHVNMVLDYTNADIRVDDGTNIVNVLPLDTNGNPLTSQNINVQFPDLKKIVIAPGIPAYMTLDFDLKASNEVDLVNKTVTVDPLLIADANPQKPKIHRARGPLLSVNAANNSFRINIRPFIHIRGQFGKLNVLTGNETYFEIDGQPYSGSAGITALDAKPFATAVVVEGEWIVGTRKFRAKEVYAGSSVAYGTKDVVRGSVTARNGDVLTVRGASLLRADGTLIFNDDVEVTLGTNTVVTKQRTGSANKDDISVGQRILVIGTLGPDLNNPTMDATEGLARMMFTSMSATVNVVNSSQLVLDVQHINGRNIAIYDFSGTGGSNSDSDGASYRIDTGSLSLTDIDINTPVRVRGFAVPFGQAVTDDFTAQTVINLNNVPALMLVGWDPATTAPFISIDNTSAVINLAGTGDRHHLFRYGVVTDLTSLAGSPTLLSSSNNGLFAIHQNGSVQLYTQYDSFVTGINNKLAIANAKSLASRGTWTTATETLSTNLISVRFK